MKKKPVIVFAVALVIAIIALFLGIKPEVGTLPPWAAIVLGTLLLSLVFMIWTTLSIREKAGLYRALVENSPVAYVTINTKGVFISSNKAFEQHTGYKQSELLGKHYRTIMIKESIQVADAQFERILGGGAPGLVQLGIKTKSGKEKYFDTRGELIQLKGRNVIMLTILKDALGKSPKRKTK